MSIILSLIQSNELNSVQSCVKRYAEGKHQENYREVYQKTLLKDEIWHSTYEPNNQHVAGDNVTGLDFCLSDVQWAFGANDFLGFEEQIQSFIKTELAQPSLPITSPLYR